MKMTRTDCMISQFDSLLRVLSPQAVQPLRSSPAHEASDGAMAPGTRRISSSWVRGHYTQALCLQALYQGQALAARQTRVQQNVLQVAGEQWDQLGWCRQRLAELGGRTSLLDPILYISAMSLSAASSRLDEAAGLGFVHAATEATRRQSEHVIRELPEDDRRSRAIFQAMQGDDAHHGRQMLEGGARAWASPARWGLGVLVRSVAFAARRV
ncbi:demethoxyubiquinone hydroxylase family protein [Larsenimonas rhizosphaerae]|uniref:Demethoxyubiquinone hydroxylase family protein n=1 Tax=Larsenimonas rhizosphaerae TaxID=2944682 RepID=A0AA42CTA3_9GAMM|nr:demethoxyubiquinone hydroxylase family protein [Larsenimonas rhizosphaerae]MCM2130174.1 demethoxyubiquinone hydroxylase family protein [Larsenimonas rhizosphaerae]MCX2522861.1 demethoxyubiquinone hydroxylase family protein [Larsenimonas rhizosphaerae]